MCSTDTPLRLKILKEPMHGFRLEWPGPMTYPMWIASACRATSSLTRFFLPGIGRSLSVVPMMRVNWTELAKASGDSLPGESALANLAKRFPIDINKIPPEQMAFIRRFAPANRRILQYSFKLDKPAHYRYYRLNVNNPTAKTWGISDLGMYRRWSCRACRRPLSVHQRMEKRQAPANSGYT